MKPPMRRRTAVLIPLLLLGGCLRPSPEAQVRDRLIAAGVKPHMAECMAEKLVRKLSTDELRTLGKVAKMPREHPDRPIGFNELADRIQAIGDPHIVEVVTRAGLGCVIAG